MFIDVVINPAPAEPNVKGEHCAPLERDSGLLSRLYTSGRAAA